MRRSDSQVIKHEIRRALRRLDLSARQWRAACGHPASLCYVWLVGCLDMVEQGGEECYHVFAWVGSQN